MSNIKTLSTLPESIYYPFRDDNKPLDNDLLQLSINDGTEDGYFSSKIKYSDLYFTEGSGD